MMTQINQLLASVNKGTREGCLLCLLSGLVYLARCAFCFRSGPANRDSLPQKFIRAVDGMFRTFYKLGMASRAKNPAPHHVVYDNYVAIEIIIFLTLS